MAAGCQARQLLIIAVIGLHSVPTSSEIDRNLQMPRTVRFLVLAPYADSVSERPSWNGGPALVPAVRLAVDRINNRTDVLPGHRIELLEANSGCQLVPAALLSFVSNIFRNVTEDGNIVGVIGPGCSEAATVLGSLSVRDTVSMIQVSPSATSPLLTDTTTYSNTYRTISSALQYIGMFIHLMNINKWRWENIAVLYDSNRLHCTFNCLVDEALPAKIGYTSGISDFYFPLSEIAANFRIIVLLTGPQLAREVICLAYHSEPQVLYPLHQWVIFEMTKNQFLMNVELVYNGKSYNCSEEVMARAIDGIIFSSFRLAREDKDSPTDVDLTFNEYNSLYRDYLEQHQRELTGAAREYEEDAKDYAASYYDATWALAMGLNNSMHLLSEYFSLPLASYSRGQPQQTSLIEEQLRNLEFRGLLGNVSFQNSTQESSTIVDLYQCMHNECALVGFYDGMELTITSDDAQFIPDSLQTQLTTIDGITAFVSVFIVILVTIFTAFLHIIYIWYRKEKCIKARSYELSYILFSGCYVLLIQVFIGILEYSGKQETDHSRTRNVIVGVVCNTILWMHVLGVVLILGTLTAQLWRVYRIFNHFSTKGLYISDPSLTLYVIFLFLITLIYLILWTVSDPLVPALSVQEIVYNGQDDPFLAVRSFCTCKYYGFWIPPLAMFEILLIITVATLASLNRHVRRKHFGNSRAINTFVYCIAPMSFFPQALAFALEYSGVYYTYVFWQFGCLSLVFLTSIFILLPPVWPILSGWYQKRALFCYKTFQISHV